MAVLTTLTQVDKAPCIASYSLIFTRAKHIMHQYFFTKVISLFEGLRLSSYNIAPRKLRLHWIIYKVVTEKTRSGLVLLQSIVDLLEVSHQSKSHTHVLAHTDTKP